jgi:hypothetical protein
VEEFSMDLGARGILRALQAVFAPLFARQTQRDLVHKASVQALLGADGRLTDV